MTAQNSPGEIIQEAYRKHQEGDLQSAIVHYERFLALTQPNPDVLSNLGAAYSGVGDYEKAIRSYEQALALQSAPAIRFNLALAYYKAASFQKAREGFEQVLSEQPSNFSAALLLADICFRLGEYSRVVEILRPFEGKTDDQGFNYLMGTALIREGQVSEGEVYVDRILRDGDSAAAHLMMGLAQMKAGELDLAASEIRKAVELDPNLPGVHSMLGQSLMYLKELDQAKQAFEMELQLNPNDFDANFYLGSLNQESRLYDEALTYLEKAAVLRPQSKEVSYQIASICLIQGDLERARAFLEKLVAQQPEFIEAHVSLATTYHRLGLSELADQERRIVIALHAEQDKNKPKERRNVGGRPDSPRAP